MSDDSPHTHHAIDYIEFSITAMAEAQRFYGMAFGWTLKDYGPTYTGVEGDGKEMGGLNVESNPPSGGLLVVLYSNDFESNLSKVREAGGRIVKEPFNFPGGRRFHFVDPSGKEFAVWSIVAECDVKTVAD